MVQALVAQKIIHLHRLMEPLTMYMWHITQQEQQLVRLPFQELVLPHQQMMIAQALTQLL